MRSPLTESISVMLTGIGGVWLGVTTLGDGSQAWPTLIGFWVWLLQGEKGTANPTWQRHLNLLQMG